MHLVTFNNPFDPGDHTVTPIEHPCWLAELSPEEDERAYIMLVNGHPILRSDWDVTWIDGNDLVTVGYLPAGGGDTKDIFRAVALIAVAAVAWWAGGALAAGLTSSGLVASSTAATAIGGGLSLAVAAGGSILVNALIPVTSPYVKETADSTFNQSPTYSISGGNNTARLGQVIPVQYGRMKFFPDFGAAPWTWYRWNEQDLYELLILGEGEYAIESIAINDVDISNYTDVAWRQYGPNEDPDLFPTQIFSTSAGNHLLENMYQQGSGGERWSPAIIANPAGTILNGVHIDINAPAGAYRIEEDTGDIKDIPIGIRAELRHIDQSANPISPWTLAGEWWVTYSTREAIRVSYSLTVPANWQRVQVRVCRVDKTVSSSERVVDKFYLETVKGGTFTSAGSLAATSKLAIKVRASNQLTSQTAVKVSVIGTRKLKLFRNGAFQTTATATRGCGDALIDALTNDVYGAGLPITRLDIPAMLALNNIEFDGRFDSSSTAWEVITTIAKVARAVVYSQGGLLRVARDTGKGPTVAVFSSRNIVAGSFALDYVVPTENTAEAVKVEYWDETVWAQRYVSVRYDGAQLSEEDVEASVNLFGCVNRNRAYSEAWYLARSNRYRRRLISFQTEMEGFIPSLGDEISVSYDMPGWAKSVDIKAWLNSTTVQFAEAIDWASIGGGATIAFQGADNSRLTAIGVTRGSADDIGVLVSAPSQSVIPGKQFGVIATTSNFSRVAIVTKVTPASLHLVTIEAIIDDTRAHDNSPTPPTPTPPIRPCPTPTVVGLQLSGFPGYVIVANWDADSCAKYFVVEYAQWTGATPPATGWYKAGNYNYKTARFTSAIGGDIWVRVAAVGDNQGAWVYSNTRAIAAGVPGNPTGGPPAPTNIICTSFIGALLLEWLNHPSAEAVQVLRAPVADVARTELIATVRHAERYFDRSMPQLGIPYYYYLRSVDVNGLVGPESVVKSCIPDRYVKDVIDEIHGVIDKSWLTQELIQFITYGNPYAQEISDRLDSIQGAQPWDSTRNYKAGEYVTFNGDLYLSTQPSLNKQPDQNPNEWHNIGQYAGALAALGVRIDTVVAEVNKQSGDINNLAQQINAVQANQGVHNLLNDPQFEYDTTWTFLSADVTGPAVKYATYTSGLFGARALKTGVASNERTARLSSTGATISTSYVQIAQSPLPVEVNKRYQFSAYVGALPHAVSLFILFYDSADTLLTTESAVVAATKSGGNALTDWDRPVVFGVAPAGAVYARVIIRITQNGTASQSNLTAYIVRPMFAVAGATQTEPSTWGPGLSAAAEAFNTLRSQVTTIDGRVTANATAITAANAELTAQNNRITGNANALTTLDTKVTNIDGKIAANATDISELRAQTGSANLLNDPIFESKLGIAWFKTYSAGVVGPSYWQGNSSDWNQILYTQETGINASAASIPANNHVGIYQLVSVIGSTWYALSVHLSILNTTCRIAITWLDVNKNVIVVSSRDIVPTTPADGPSSIYWPRFLLNAQSPANARFAYIYLLNVGPASGTHTVFFFRPQLWYSTAKTTLPPPWTPGENPPLFAALKREGMAWADGTGGGGVKYTVKAEIEDGDNIVQAGYGLSVVKEDNQWVSDFFINANRFAIRDPAAVPGTGLQYPFVVMNGNVYMRNAYIQNASIDNAKIANLAVTNIKMAEYSNVLAGNFSAHLSNGGAAWFNVWSGSDWSSKRILFFLIGHTDFYPDSFSGGSIQVGLKSSNNDALIDSSFHGSAEKYTNLIQETGMATVLVKTSDGEAGRKIVYGTIAVDIQASGNIPFYIWSYYNRCSTPYVQVSWILGQK